MAKHNSPRVNFSKKLSEIYLHKGEIFTVNVENTGDYGSHYQHIEVWLTPKGEPIVFLPDNIKVMNYDEWNEEYKKYFQ